MLTFLDYNYATAAGDTAITSTGDFLTVDDPARKAGIFREAKVGMDRVAQVVPAVAWLFGSGLFCLAGVTRRRQHS